RCARRAGATPADVPTSTVSPSAGIRDNPPVQEPVSFDASTAQQGFCNPVPFAHSSHAQLLIHGAAAPSAWWSAVLDALPPGVAVLAPAPPDARVGAVDLSATASRADLLSWARTRRPGVDVVLLAAGTELPPYWYERLAAALAQPDVLAAGPLDNVA